MADPVPPGPPSPSGAAQQMSPQQAQQVLGQFKIGPNELPMVAAACETMMMAMQGGGQQQQPQQPGLMEALSSRYQEPTA